jgi:hypothetical protein
MPRPDDSQAVETFRTADAKVAVIATAIGGKLLDLITENPSRFMFVFGGEVPTDLDLRIQRGGLHVDARAVITAMNLVYGLIRDRRRGR